MITLTYSTSYISEQIGYAAWVHVSGGTKDYAVHAGYASHQALSEGDALSQAQQLARVLSVAGVSSNIEKGPNG